VISKDLSKEKTIVMRYHETSVDTIMITVPLDTSKRSLSMDKFWSTVDRYIYKPRIYFEHRYLNIDNYLKNMGDDEIIYTYGADTGDYRVDIDG